MTTLREGDYLGESEAKKIVGSANETHTNADTAPLKNNSFETEDASSYLEVDPNDAEWVKSWYDPTIGEEPTDSSHTLNAKKAAPYVAALPPAPALTPANIILEEHDWDTDDEHAAVLATKNWAQKLWAAKGLTVIMPLTLTLLILSGLTMAILNILWAAN